MGWPEWRNGRRIRLKIGRPEGRVGSTPTFGTRGGHVGEARSNKRADREALMREHAKARADRSSLTPGSPEWRAAAARVAAIEVDLARITALEVPPARIARPEAKGR